MWRQRRLFAENTLHVWKSIVKIIDCGVNIAGTGSICGSIVAVVARCDDHRYCCSVENFDGPPLAEPELLVLTGLGG